jgi:hypothetical protein
MRFLAPVEVAALASSIDIWFQPMIYTAVETGMRWSELVGLRRSVLDLLRCRSAVTEQLVYIGGSTGLGEFAERPYRGFDLQQAALAAGTGGPWPGWVAVSRSPPYCGGPGPGRGSGRPSEGNPAEDWVTRPST